MLQVRKSCFCGISAIFFQCLFYEWNTIINYSFHFVCFFLRIIFWKGALLFSGGGASFLSGWTPLMGWICFDLMVFLKKNQRLGGTAHYGKPWSYVVKHTLKLQFHLILTTQMVSIIILADNRKKLHIYISSWCVWYWLWQTVNVVLFFLFLTPFSTSLLVQQLFYQILY